MGWYSWRPYVPVAVRRARALKKVEKLRKKGLDIQPVEIEGRKIARTFWGEGWCDHLESFSDYENRLPRGRTYVRNGSVCHLEITEGTIKAMVSGSELYNVNVSIKKLPRKKWKDVKGRCAGQIGSLLELLLGRLSKSVMSVVTDRNKGLFPLPREISLNCSCPDWAIMCKHVAAVLYGVGARLDEKPELLFLLRGVDHEELISVDTDAVTAATDGKRGGRRRIAEGNLKDVFGIEIAEEETPGEGQTRSQRKRKASPKQKAPRAKKGKKTGRNSGKRAVKKQAKVKRAATPRKKCTPRRKTGTKDILVPTGKTVREQRAKFDMSQAQFARLLNVSTPSVANWEKKRGRLNLQARTLDALRTAVKISKKKAWKRLTEA